MGWHIALGIVLLLAVLPLGVSVVYDSEGPLIKIIAGPLRLKVYPLPKKKDKKKPEKKKVIARKDMTWRQWTWHEMKRNKIAG